MEEGLKLVTGIVNVVRQILPRDAAIAVAEDSRFIYYQPGPGVDLKIRPGDMVKEGSLTMRAMRDGNPIAAYVSEELYGVPYYGISAPLAELGDDNGCLTVIFPPDHARESLLVPARNYLVGKGEDRWVPVPLDDILFFESTQGKTVIVTREGRFVNRHTLTELEWLLPRERFLRVHRAFIVNLDKIAEIFPDIHSTFTLVMKEQGLVPVSQKYASRFRRLLDF